MDFLIPIADAKLWEQRFSAWHAKLTGRKPYTGKSKFVELTGPNVDTTEDGQFVVISGDLDCQGVTLSEAAGLTLKKNSGDAGGKCPALKSVRKEDIKSRGPGSRGGPEMEQ